MKTITFKVDDSFYVNLKHQADKLGLSVSSLIRLILLTQTDYNFSNVEVKLNNDN